MSSAYNRGRVAGFWYLLLCVVGPLRLMYIPTKLFVHGDAAATVNNIAAHEWLFHFGIVGDSFSVVVLIFPVLASYRLFKDVDQYLAMLVLIVGEIALMLWLVIKGSKPQPQNAAAVSPADA